MFKKLYIPSHIDAISSLALRPENGHLRDSHHFISLPNQMGRFVQNRSTLLPGEGRSGRMHQKKIKSLVTQCSAIAVPVD